MVFRVLVLPELVMEGGHTAVDNVVGESFIVYRDVQVVVSVMHVGKYRKYCTPGSLSNTSSTARNAWFGNNIIPDRFCLFKGCKLTCKYI